MNETISNQVTAPSPAANAASPRAVELLRRTRPWTLFLAIMGFVGAGLTGIATIAMAIMGIVGEAVELGGTEMWTLLGMAGLYGLLTALYLVVSVSLLRYARAIGVLSQEGGNPALEQALDAQRKFWKLMGVVVIVSMAFIVVAFIVGIGVAVAVGATGMNY